MNEAMDNNRLMDALNQISDIQNTLEDQRNRFETQLGELQVCPKVTSFSGQVTKSICFFLPEPTRRTRVTHGVTGN